MLRSYERKWRNQGGQVERWGIRRREANNMNSFRPEQEEELVSKIKWVWGKKWTEWKKSLGWDHTCYSLGFSSTLWTSQKSVPDSLPLHCGRPRRWHSAGCTCTGAWRDTPVRRTELGLHVSPGSVSLTVMFLCSICKILLTFSKKRNISWVRCLRNLIN